MKIQMKSVLGGFKQRWKSFHESGETESIKSKTSASRVRLHPVFFPGVGVRGEAAGERLMSLEAGSMKPAGIGVFHLINLRTHMWPAEADDSGADKWHSAWS